jgi:hypothetical protein
VARDLDEHLQQLDAALAGGADDGARTRAFAEAFVRPHGLDRPAAPIVADAIADVGALGPREPERPTPRTRALRLALLPFVLGNAAVACAVALASRARGQKQPAPLDADG